MHCLVNNFIHEKVNLCFICTLSLEKMPAYYLRNVFVGCHLILLILCISISKEILNKHIYTAQYISLYMFVVLLVKTSSALALH